MEGCLVIVGWWRRYEIEICGCVVGGLCGCVGVWRCGSGVEGLCDCVAVWMCRCVAVVMNGCVWVLGF